jgi:hypothetical protein
MSNHTYSYGYSIVLLFGGGRGRGGMSTVFRHVRSELTKWRVSDFFNHILKEHQHKMSKNLFCHLLISADFFTPFGDLTESHQLRATTKRGHTGGGQ